MKDELQIKLYTFTIACIDPYALAKFYAALLHWEIPYHDENRACVGAPGKAKGAYPGIMFQRNPGYEPPVWPEEPGAQQQMAHLDFAVNDLEEAVRHAVTCGASLLPVPNGRHVSKPSIRIAITQVAARSKVPRLCGTGGS